MKYSILCALLWGTTGVFVKLNQDIDLPSLIWLRFFISAVILILFFHIRPTTLLKNSTKFEWLLAFAMTLYYVCATFSFIYAPVALASFLMSLAPCVTIFCRLMIGEKVYKEELIGFAITLLGVALYLCSIFSNFNGHTFNELCLGITLALGAAILRALYSFYIWLEAKQGRLYNPTNSTSQTFFIGSLLFLPLVILNHLDGFKLTPFDLFNTAGLAIFATIIPNLLNSIASKAINPTLHTLINMLTPLISGLLAWLILKESLTLVAIVGICIAIAGIMYSIKSYHNKTLTL